MMSVENPPQCCTRREAPQELSVLFPPRMASILETRKDLECALSHLPPPHAPNHSSPPARSRNCSVRRRASGPFSFTVSRR
jgi:hypothetical protein